MRKSTKVIEIIKRLLRSPGVIRELFDEEAYYKKNVIASYEFTTGLPLVNILDLFPDFNETIEPYSFLDGTSLPIDIALLKSFVRSYADCRYLEIGTWRGESVASIASIANHCITINLPDQAMREMRMSDDYIAAHLFFSKNLNHVQHIRHDSQTFDFNSLKEKSDVIFIDGDHHYESVRLDTINAFKQLANDQGTIVWHDYAFSPETIRWTVLAGILDGCPAAKRKYLYQVSNTMCAMYTTRPVKSTPLKPFKQPDKYFTIQIKAHKI